MRCDRTGYRDTQAVISGGDTISLSRTPQITTKVTENERMDARHGIRGRIRGAYRDILLSLVMKDQLGQLRHEVLSSHKNFAHGGKTQDSISGSSDHRNRFSSNFKILGATHQSRITHLVRN